MFNRLRDHRVLRAQVEALFGERSPAVKVAIRAYDQRRKIFSKAAGRRGTSVELYNAVLPALRGIGSDTLLATGSEGAYARMLGGVLALIDALAGPLGLDLLGVQGNLLAEVSKGLTAVDALQRDHRILLARIDEKEKVAQADEVSRLIDKLRAYFEQHRLPI